MAAQLLIVLTLAGNSLAASEEVFALFVIAGSDLPQATVNSDNMASLLNLVIREGLGCADVHKPVLAGFKNPGSAKSPFVIQILLKAGHGNLAFNPPVKGVDGHDLAVLLKGIVPASDLIQLRSLKEDWLPKPVKIALNSIAALTLGRIDVVDFIRLLTKLSLNRLVSGNNGLQNRLSHLGSEAELLSQVGVECFVQLCLAEFKVMLKNILGCEVAALSVNFHAVCQRFGIVGTGHFDVSFNGQRNFHWSYLLSLNIL